MTTAVAASRSTRSGHNLPSEVAGFVGREREVAELKRLLPQTRLLTLTGCGGCGKTRLALRVAADLVPSFPDGVWLVECAPLADSALVPRAVAAVLGVRGTAGQPLLATLAVALASRRLLLVLDNCEHLIGACARLAETLLRACPHLRILATSREPLRLPGEVTWRVPSLALPAPGPLAALESLAQVEAVALFLDRARARQPAFTLTAQNAPAVAAICHHLGGLPLAIELAAAQMGALTPAQIASRLHDALRLLGGGSRTLPRQETLRATLDWSYALLSGVEQVLFLRLAVFAGGCDVEAVERVCSGEGLERADVLALLAALVEKSLLEPQVQAQDVRYRLLEPVRQYAWERLTSRGEADSLQRRHAHYLLELAEAAEPRLMSRERGLWMERLATEQDNLRTALTWSRRAAAASDRAVGLRLAEALMWFWTLRGDVSEGLDWVESALARGSDLAPTMRAKALYAAAEMAWLLGRTTLARARAEESIALFRALGDKRWLAYALQSLPMAIDHPRADDSVEESLRLFEEVGDAWGTALALAALDIFALVRDGDPTGRGRARLEEALARWRELGDDWGVAQVLNFLGDLARSQDDVAGATARYEESLASLRRQGLTGTVPSLLHNLGYMALRQGDSRRALRLFRESLALFRDQGDQRGIADCLDGLAGVLGAMKQPERAARLLGAAEALRGAIGATVWPANEADYSRSLATVRGQLDEAALATAWASGRALPVERAVAEVLPEDAAGAQSGGAEGFDLTEREREVATLIAQGLTNRQIGTALLSPRGRPGCTSSTFSASWASRPARRSRAGPSRRGWPRRPRRRSASPGLRPASQRRISSCLYPPWHVNISPLGDDTPSGPA
ncbi:MAG TPA: tetratricopeptide repeat protein [Chloroflexota bacterium]|nr:tetratricopeptide repeat protein [Chloroflexota bacterium]